MRLRSLLAASVSALALVAVPAADGDAARSIVVGPAALNYRAVGALAPGRSVRFEFGSALRESGTILVQHAITPDVMTAEGELSEGGHFTVVTVKGRALTATVHASGATYVFGELANGTPVVQRLDRTTLARLCGVGHALRFDTAARPRISTTVRIGTVATAGSPSVIRLAVFYPHAAVADFEDPDVPRDPKAPAHLRERVENAIALINAMFVASRVDALVVPAGIEELELPLSDSLVQDVNMMNVSPIVAARRDALRANVAMLIRSGGEWQGFADVLREPKTPEALAQAREHGAFGAVQTSCIDTGFMCMVHEFAHIVGAAHDRDNADGPGFFQNSYGFWWTGNDGACHGDMMSYECLGNRETILSGPDLRDHGAATGDARNDNAAGVRAGVGVVAGYR